MYLPEKHFHCKRLTVTFLGFTERVCTESTVKRRFFWFRESAIKCYFRSHCSSRVMHLLCEHL